VRPIFDAHLDLAWSAIQWNRDLTASLEDMRRQEAHMTDHRGRGRATVTLPEMRRGRVGVCLGTVLVRSKPEVCPAGGFNRRDLDFRDQTIAYAVGQAHVAYYRQLERQGDVRMIRTSHELVEHWASWGQFPERSPVGLVLAMEGADPIVNPSQVGEWWDQGLRCVGLAHYGQGPYAMGTGSEGPVTPAGRELLKEFGRYGMILDLTHTAEPGFFEALDRYDGPVHASHNMCRKLVPRDRQFSDEQVRRLVERGGVIGMACDAWMLHSGWTIGQTSPDVVSLENVADHVDHVCQVAGNARHVGIGSDLDGGFGTEQTPGDLNSIVDLQKLAAVLASRGYSDADIDAVYYGNWLRFFTEHLPKAK
jgi:membrane dipeptidase